MKQKLNIAYLQTKNFLMSNKAVPIVLSLAYVCMMVIGMTGTAYATTPEVANVNFTGVLEYIAKIYKTWSIPFMIIDLIAYFVVKDDKKKEIFKKALIGMLVAYVLCFIVGPIVSSIKGVGTTFESTKGNQ